MTSADTTRLVILAAIWGAAFVFMRIAAPVLGTVPTAASRAVIGALALMVYLRAIRFDARWRANGGHYLAIGIINSAIPFALFSFAAAHIPASLAVVLNAASPLFGAVLSAMFLAESLSARKVLGLLTGAGGVAFVSQPAHFPGTPLFWWAVAACLGAAFCYGLTGIYLKRVAPGLPSMGVAAGSQVGAALVLLPLVPFFPPQSAATPQALISVALLGLLCSGVAFVLYFRLIADIGATRALTVTFLIPAFGMVWGALLLGESIGWPVVAGCAVVVAGTWMVVRDPGR